MSAANAVDAQAAYESVFSLWGAIMGGVNLLMHGAGWMEGGLHAGFEKVILDAELLGMVAAFLDPVVVDDDTLAIDGDGRGRSGRALLRRRSTPSPGTGPRSTSRCCATGGTTRPGRRPARPEAAGKANRIWKELLAAYEPPPMDPRAARSSTRSSPAARPRAASPTDF